MMIRTAVVASLLLGLMASVSLGAAECRIESGSNGSHTYRWYACESDPQGQLLGTYVEVNKAWFKQHCRTWSNASANPSDAATCDAWGDDPAALSKGGYKTDAKPPAAWKTRLERIGIGAAGVAIVTACVMGGGCGFMGGD